MTTRTRRTPHRRTPRGRTPPRRTVPAPAAEPYATDGGTVHLARPRPEGDAFARFERSAARRMASFGLAGWTFGFSRGKRTLGVTKIPWGSPVGEIRLSKYLLSGNHASLAEETLLHEIAHAVAYRRHGRTSIGHGPLWRAVATEVGAAPVATCRTGPLAEPRHRWTCDRCGHEVGLYRTPKYAPSTYRHRGCGGRFVADGQAGLVRRAGSEE